MKYYKLAFKILIMYRVYFDWNVYCLMRDRDKNTLGQELYDLVKGCDDIMCIPYSQVHLQDLTKGSEKKCNQAYINNDLNFIDSISKNYYIALDALKTKEIHPYYVSATEAFENIKENHGKEIADYVNQLFDYNDNPDLSLITEKVNLYLRTMPISFDYNLLTNDPLSIKMYEGKFHEFKENNTLYNFMLGWSRFYKEMKENPDVYNELTTVFRNSLNINTSTISNANKPIEEINKVLSEKLDSNFDLISSTVNPNIKGTSDLFLKFVTEMGFLDMIGYHPDKLDKKNLYSNYTNDTHHSFYAAHCDYFISEEKKLLEKSRIMYDRYGCKTKTLTVKEFIDEFKQIKKEFTIEDIINPLNNTIENEEGKYIISGDDFKAYQYELNPPVLGCFNLLYTRFYNDNSTAYVFRHFRYNFSNFVLYTEIESIVDKFLKIFGNDVNQKAEITEDDRKQIADNEWTGRVWIIEGFIFLLRYEKSDLSLILEIEPITERLILENNLSIVSLNNELTASNRTDTY